MQTVSHRCDMHHMAHASEQTDTPICPNYSLAKVFPGFLHGHIFLKLCPSATNITHPLMRRSKNLGRTFFLAFYYYTIYSYLLVFIGFYTWPQSRNMAGEVNGLHQHFWNVLLPSNKKTNKGKVRHLDKRWQHRPTTAGGWAPSSTWIVWRGLGIQTWALVPRTTLLRKTLNSFKDLGELPLPYSSSLSFKQFSSPTW